MQNKILLQERAELSKSIIDNEINRFSKQQELLQLLQDCGLKLTKVNNWSEIDAELQKNLQFKNATLEFNLEALGVIRKYETAKALYNDYLRNLPFVDEVTDERIESIKEEYRIYTANDKQIEAYQLALTIIENLNKAIDLGMPIDTYNATGTAGFIGRDKERLVIDKLRLENAVIAIK